ncbi:MAG: hypothetical protein JRI23_08200 [Deltaproteobacteria bacterium]|jgi:hypothetical protein|nr:hypothetical protein [Deltaproteobacteria bacterium]MBW2531594.1 hypothetical protein [Deltaproteobacteria bacterium]
MDPWLVLLFFGLMGFVGWYAAGRPRRRRSTSAAWHRVAKRFGGTAAQEHGDVLNRTANQHALQVTVDGIAITADLANLASRRDVELLTVVRAEVERDYGFELKVAPRGVATDLDRILGPEDVPTGEEAFDRAFYVRSQSPELVPLWLDGPLRRAISASTGYSFTISAARVEARRTGRDDDERRLSATIKAVARLARRGEVLRSDWRRLCKRLDGTIDSPGQLLPAIEVDVDGVPVTLTIEPPQGEAQSVCTQVTTLPLGRQLERFAVGGSVPSWAASLEPVPLEQAAGADRSVVSSDPSKTARWLDARRQALRSIAPASLSYDGEILSLCFDGVTMDVGRIRTAAKLIGTLGGRDDQGPYR